MADGKGELALISAPLRAQWLRLLEQGLRDDGWEYDWTAIGTLPSGKVRARIVAKSAGVWAGAAGLEALGQAGFQAGPMMGATISVSGVAKDGSRFKAGDVLANLEGEPRLILAAERPLLNLVSYVSGIATRTRALVDLVEKSKSKARVTSTRKTLPGYRDLAVYGVLAGGGLSHRLSLSGGVLIKENHIAAAGSIAGAVNGARAVAPHGLRVEIEVRNLQELEQALAAGVDIVMLDNFTPDQVRDALSKLSSAAPRPLVEVSGGIDETSIASYAQAGVDVLSVGSLTHSVRSVDLSLLVAP